MNPTSLAAMLFQSLSLAISSKRVIFALWVVLIYLALKVVYRLFWSKLSKFPGPRFAAASKLYEAYHVLIKDDWLETLKRLHRENGNDIPASYSGTNYGPIVRIGPNELHFADHEFCLEFHKRPDLKKCTNYYGLLDTLLGGLADPHLHHERKTIMQPLFSGSTLSRYSNGVLNEHLETLHDRIVVADPHPDEEKMNLTHYLWAFTNDVMTSYIFEEDLRYTKAADLEAVHDSTRAFSAIDLATVLRSMPPVKKLFDIVPSLRRWSPLGWLDELVSTRLDQIRKGNKPGVNETGHGSVLARLWHSLPDSQLVTQECAQAIFIGNESLLSNLTFLIHYLIQNPACVKRLRAELDTLDIGTYGRQIWRDPKLFQLKYLDAICKESTRLSSPGWHRQPRQIAEPVVYNSHVIPSMTSMSFTLKMLEDDPVLFPNPEEFSPERWLSDTPEGRKSRSSAVTFGTGSRTCLGQFCVRILLIRRVIPRSSIARQVLRKTIVCLVYNFNIYLWDEDRDKAEGYKYLNTYPKKGQEGYIDRGHPSGLEVTVAINGARAHIPVVNDQVLAICVADVDAYDNNPVLLTRVAGSHE
ncbi:cytochrome P450 [Xylariales sp. PMI_506]|nr:cytochrome P450 [Xylariales sp. PMI_506]